MANRKITSLVALTAPATDDVLPIIDISETGNDLKNKKITYGELFKSLPDGSNTAPALAFNSSTTTGIYRSAANELSIATNGGQAIKVEANNKTTIYGDLVVTGGTTTISSTTIDVADKNIQLATGNSSDAGADGGGLTLKGATDKTWNWIDSTDAWTANQHIDVASGKVFKIAGTQVLSATTLGSGVVNSSLTSVGTLGSLTVTNAVTAGSLDISGGADIDGTLEADAYTVNGTALNEYIADTVGAMVSSNTETNIVVTYNDSDNTLDFVISSYPAASISGTTLASNVVTSSLTSVGTLGLLNVTNTVTANLFSGSGASLTALNADNISSGTLASARIEDSAITSAKILDGTIVNADINASAAIAGTKISPDFGSQLVQTTGTVLGSGMTISNAQPRLTFTDTNHNSDFRILVEGGSFQIEDTTNSNADRLTIASDGTVDVTGNLDVGAGIDVTGAITSTGNLTITNTNPKLLLTDSDANSDFSVHVQSGTFHVRDETNSANRIRVESDGTINLKGNVDCDSGIDVTGNITVSGTVDGVDIATRNTLFGGLTSSSGVLTNGVTATTQSASDNSTKVATTAYTDTAISNLVDSSPSALNTLNELAAALGDDANFSTTVTNSIATKLPLAGGTLTGNVIYNDNVISYFGSDSDLSMHHTGSTGYVKNTTGTLYIQDDSNVIIGKVTDSHTGMKFVGGGALELYHNNNLRFATSNDGATLTGRLTPAANNTYGLGSSSLRWANFYSGSGNFSGTVTANAFSGSGASLTNVNATTLDSIDSGSFLRSDAADTASGDITFSGGAGAVTVAAASDIRLTDGTWTGDITTPKLQAHSNYLYICGGPSGIIFRENNQNRWFITGSGHLRPGSDSTYNIGESGVRVLNAYFDNISVANDGSGSGLDADLLDGQEGSYYRNASNLNAGTVATARLGSGTASSSVYLRGDGTWAAVSAGSATTLGGLTASQFLRSDAEDSSSAPLNINGGTANGSNDATLYVTATNNNDWGLKVDKYNGSATEYGVMIDVASSSNHALRIRGNDSEVFRVSGNGTVTAGGSNTVWHAGNDGSGSNLDADHLDGQEGSYYRNASNLNAGTLPAARLDSSSAAEGGISVVGNFGQFEGHGTYNNFNTEPSYWGWNFIQGTTNAPNSTSGQWYRCRLSLGSGYGKGSDSGDYSLEMAIPRSSHTSAGGLHIRSIENGSEGSWHEVASKVGSNTVWHAGNDGSGSGLDADLLDGQEGSYYRNASNLNAGTYPDLFSPSTRYNIGLTDGSNADSYDKWRVWNSSSYTIGMHSGMTHGWLNDYAMTFTMNPESDRGFVWRDTSDGQSSAAMSLTTDGNLNVAGAIGIAGNTSNYWMNGSWGFRHKTPHGYIEFGPANTSHAHIYTDRSNFYFNKTVIYANGNVMWHAANDGSGSGLDADTLDGLQLGTGRNNSADQVVRTNGSGYIDCGYINTSCDDTGTGVDCKFYASQDDYIRYIDLSSLRSVVNSPARSSAYPGRESYSTNTAYWMGSMGHGADNFDTTVWDYGSGAFDVWSNPSGQPSGTSHWCGLQSMHYSNGSNRYGMRLMLGAGQTALAYIQGRWGTTTYGWHKLWNEANDGSGSGLDADLWDGWDRGSYLNQSVVTTSGPTFTDLYVNSWLRNNDSNEGLYNTSTTQHWYSDNAAYFNLDGNGTSVGIRFRDSHSGTIRGYVYADNSNQIGFLDHGGSWAFYYNDTRNVSSHDLIPATNNDKNLGTSGNRWANLYVNDAHFSNEGSSNSVDGTWGDWTLQEGEENIFMINNRSGKRYKMALQEVS